MFMSVGYPILCGFCMVVGSCMVLVGGCCLWWGVSYTDIMYDSDDVGVQGVLTIRYW